MLRIFRRDRLFHATVIVLLALGIGSNTLVFSLVDALLLKPLPVRDPGNLYLLERNRPLQVRPETFFQYPHYLEVVRKNPLLAGAVAEQGWYQPAVVPFRQGDTVRLIMAQMVSPNYFRELGIKAYLGRVLDESDAKATGALPVVLSYQFWKSQFGGDPAVVGRTIRLKDTACTVVGVLPEDFHSSDLDRAPDVRVPVSDQIPPFGNVRQQSFQILVRLRPGVSPAQAAASMRAGVRSLDDRIEREANARLEHPLPEAALQKSLLEWELNFSLALRPIANGVSQVRTQFSRALWVLLGGVGLLLLAVCANVAGLLLARAGERRREIGIRLAIGAGRWHIVRQLLFENLVLAAAGAALGAVFAWSAAPELLRLLPPVRDFGQYASPQLLRVTPDLRILGFAAAATLLTVMASALLPAWRATRVDLAAEMKLQPSGARPGAAGIVPIALQVAFCTVLLAAAGLSLRTYQNLQRLDPGFDREHVISFTFDPLDAGYPPTDAGRFYRDLLDRAAVLPGVRAAAYAGFGVMRGVGLKSTVAPEGVVLPKSTFLNTSIHQVTPGYFDTMGIPLLAGRALTAADATAKPAHVVVNRAFADAFFPRANPVGKRFVTGTDGTQPPNYIIVGVVATAKYRGLREVDPSTFYTALDLHTMTSGSLILYVRTYGAPAAVAAGVRQAGAGLGPGVPLLESLTLDREVRDSLWQERLVAILSAFFAIAAVLLAAIGLYGALARSVARRSRELGIRLAIGARAPHIVAAVSSPLAVAVGCGMGAGFIGSAMLLRFTRALLFGVDPVDPASYAAAAVLILCCCAAGAAVPLLRAVRIDPADTLRAL